MALGDLVQLLLFLQIHLKLLELLTEFIRLFLLGFAKQECIEDGGNLLFLPMDFALFGKPIPIRESDSFNRMILLAE